MSKVTDSDVRLSVLFGLSDVNAWIDDVSLVEISPVIIGEAQVPDAGLRTAMENATGKVFGSITNVDLSLLRFLNAVNLSITDLSGVDLCGNLEELKIGENQFTDLTPIIGLYRLKSLQIVNDNCIVTPDFLIINAANFPAIEKLGLNGRYGDDLYSELAPIIPGIATFQRLKDLELEMFSSQFDDSVFSMLYNQVLSSKLPQFVRLDINHSYITDVSIPLINQLTNLVELDLHRCKYINDLSSLTDLSSLRFFEIETIGFSNLSFLNGLYSSGAFHPEDDSIIDLRENNLDLRPGKPDRIIVDNFLSSGIDVRWEEGNYTFLKMDWIENHTHAGVDNDEPSRIAVNPADNMIYLTMNSDEIFRFDQAFSSSELIVDAAAGNAIVAGDSIVFDASGNAYVGVNDLIERTVFDFHPGIHKYDSSFTVGEYPVLSLPALSLFNVKRIALDNNGNLFVVYDDTTIRKYAPDMTTMLAERGINGRSIRQPLSPLTIMVIYMLFLNIIIILSVWIPRI